MREYFDAIIMTAIWYSRKILYLQCMIRIFVLYTCFPEDFSFSFFLGKGLLAARFETLQKYQNFSSNLLFHIIKLYALELIELPICILSLIFAATKKKKKKSHKSGNNLLYWVHWPYWLENRATVCVMKFHYGY